MFQKISKIRKLSFPDLILFIRIFIFMGIARACLLYVPFKRIKNKLGIINKESKFYDIDYDKKNYILKLHDLIILASNHTPWQSKCFVKALTAQHFLYNKNLSSTLYLGVSKDNSGLLAHSWLRCGKIFVTGENKDGYSVVAKFMKGGR